MIKSKLAITIDSVFISLLCSFILYAWINRYLKNAFLSFFICNIALVLLFFIFFKYFIKKHNLENLKEKDLSLAKKCFHHLKYCPDNESITFFEKLLNSKNKTTNIYENHNQIFYINIKQPLCENDFLTANEYKLSSPKNKNLFFISIAETEDFKNTLSSSPITYTLYNQTELFELMKIKNYFPINSFSKDKFSKFKLLKTKLKQSLSKQNFKHFLFSGLSLIAISLFLPFMFYYLIIGTILIFLSLVCLLSKPTQTEKPKQKLIDIIKK